MKKESTDSTLSLFSLSLSLEILSLFRPRRYVGTWACCKRGIRVGYERGEGREAMEREVRGVER